MTFQRAYPFKKKKPWCTNKGSGAAADYGIRQRPVRVQLRLNGGPQLKPTAVRRTAIMMHVFPCGQIIGVISDTG